MATAICKKCESNPVAGECNVCRSCLGSMFRSGRCPICNWVIGADGDLMATHIGTCSDTWTDEDLDAEMATLMKDINMAEHIEATDDFIAAETTPDYPLL